MKKIPQYRIVGGKMWFEHRVHGWLFAEASDRNIHEIKQSRYKHLYLDSDEFHCPCCGHIMAGQMAHRGSPGYKHRRTRGHLHPKTGWPRGRPRPWIWQCSRCNENQAGRTLWEWAQHLEFHRDPRAPAVTALADKFASYLSASSMEIAHVQQNRMPETLDPLRGGISSSPGLPEVDARPPEDLREPDDVPPAC